ncbi:MAG: hypothetical protein ACRD5Z_11620, partial [Bryobacteraceae bacterium]
MNGLLGISGVRTTIIGRRPEPRVKCLISPTSLKADARTMTMNSVSEVDKLTWLRLAQEWTRLLRTRAVQIDQKDW